MRRSLLPILAMTAGCAGNQAAPSPTAGLPSRVSIAAEEPADAAAVALAEEALSSGRHAEAAHVADSLFAVWEERPEISERTRRRLAEVYTGLAEDRRAAVLLLQLPNRLEGKTRSLLREAVRGLSDAELEELAFSPRAESDERDMAVVRAELARALALAGRPDSAAAVARSVLDADPAREERQVAESVINGEIRPRLRLARIGLILPGSGRFEAVGAALLEGALLAVQEYRRESGAMEVELEVVDDSSRVDLAAPLIRRLEEGGVMGVVGPLRSEALREAARARRSKGLVVISPTASDDAGLPVNSYSLWQRSRREADVAVSMAEWMTRDLGLSRFGVLYPRLTGTAGSEAFRDAVEREGGELVGAFAYDPDSTTFEAPIATLGDLDPEAVFVLCDNPRTVLQIAPQLVYYGLRSKVIGGGVNWSDPAVVRRLDPSYADYRLVSTYLDRVNPGTAWMRFKNMYELEYHKALPANTFSALGYDATWLILRHLPDVVFRRPGTVARGLHRLRDHEGATGYFEYDRATGSLRRRTEVMMLREHRLEAPNAEAILAWAEETRQLEDFLRELDEEKEKAKDEAEQQRRKERFEGQVPQATP